MTRKLKHKDFAIAIAWPETWCKQAGGWYEWLPSGLNISKNNYYKVGHAAMVLVNSSESKCYYFDFGRYHTPFDHGRVRGELSDPELAVKTKPIISKDGDKLLNFREILNELQNNPACHGDGLLYASYASANFEKAHAKAMELQARSPIPYGPFRLNGSNCSRFVNAVLLAADLPKQVRTVLRYKVPLTPTPLNNVNALDHQVVIDRLTKEVPPCPLSSKPNRNFIKNTLPAPLKHQDIPLDAQWLAGEGAGSWFHLEKNLQGYVVTRYSPKGTVEFNDHFQPKHNGVNLDTLQDFKITYPSHYQQVTLETPDGLLTLERN